MFGVFSALVMLLTGAAAISLFAVFVVAIVFSLTLDLALRAMWILVRAAWAAAIDTTLGLTLTVAVVVVALLSLGGCASVLPHEARKRMLGMTTPDLLACLGPPAERDNTVPRLTVWTWSYTDPGASISLGSMSALGMGVALQEHGSCRVIVAMSGGHVTAVHYSPAEDGIAGPLGACKAVVSDCLEYPTRTPLPADFHPDAPDAAEKAAAK